MRIKENNCSMPCAFLLSAYQNLYAETQVCQMQICASAVARILKVYCGYFPDPHEIETEADRRSEILVKHFFCMMQVEI